MTPLYHGVSIRDAAMLVGVPESNVRKWLQRGKVKRTQDGQVDPLTLQEWWDYERQACSYRKPENQAKNNPYRIAQ